MRWKGNGRQWACSENSLSCGPEVELVVPGGAPADRRGGAVPQEGHQRAALSTPQSCY